MSHTQLTYDPFKDIFTDGCCIDWFIWEPVDTIRILKPTTYEPIHVTQKHWDAPLSCDTREIWLPVNRYCDHHRRITLPEELTVRIFFSTLHAFYDTPINLTDLMVGKRDTSCAYFIDAIRDISNGERVTWSDLLGTKSCFMPVNKDPSIRRSPYGCSGSVRFEGIRYEGTRASLMLGS